MISTFNARSFLGSSRFLRIGIILLATLSVANLAGCLQEFDNRPTDTGYTDDTNTRVDDTNVDDTTRTDADDDANSSDDAGDAGNTCATVCQKHQHCNDNGECVREPILALGASHTCALLPNRDVKCWGNNMDGQLGVGDSDLATPRTTPQLVPRPTGASRDIVTNIYAGLQQSCLTDSDGFVYCWGIHHAHDQQLNNAIAPKPVLLDNITLEVDDYDVPEQFALGKHYTCVLFPRKGEIKCWGHTDKGLLGDDNIIEQPGATSAPVKVKGGFYTQLVGGSSFACALTEDKEVYCWGDNEYGIVGVQPSNQHVYPAPQKIKLPKTVKTIVAGHLHACALLDDQSIRCWGRNDSYQLGTDDTTNRHEPVELTKNSNNIKQLALGNGYTCLLLTSGGVQCIGQNSSGQIGVTPVSPSPIREFKAIPNLKNVHTLYGGQGHMCAVHGDNEVSCWGYNSTGQLGNGSKTSTHIPQTVNLY